jgi:serine/threonine protein kinase
MLSSVLKQLHGLSDTFKKTHISGYRHGDSKPANILWFRDGEGFGTLKMGDWGDAKITKHANGEGQF